MTPAPGSELFARVVQTVSEIAELPAGTTLPPETRLTGGGLGLDSVAILHLMDALERAFAFRFQDEDLTGAVLSLGTLAELVARRSTGEGRC